MNEAMISYYEREYLETYAREEYLGVGEIVDLGCWMGVSSAQIAKGLQSNPHSAAQQRKVHAYDLFTWQPWMDSLSCVVGTSLEGKFKPGESFLEECMQRTSEWQERIEFHPGDLNRLGWAGGSIEFLFIDTMKNWELLNTIVHQFFPALIPGKSTVVHQDFCFHTTYFIHLLAYRLRDYFEPYYDIPCSASLAFKYIKPIPEHLLQLDYSLSSFTEAEIRAAFNYTQELLSLEKRPIIIASEILALIADSSGECQSRVSPSLDKLYVLQSNIVNQVHMQAIEAQSKLQALQTELEHVQNQLQIAQAASTLPDNSSAQLEPTDTELELKQVKLKAHRRQKKIHSLTAQLEEAEREISAMHTSKFWKIRLGWFRFKRLLGLSSNG